MDQTGACAVTYDSLLTAKERTDGAKESLLAAGFPQQRIYEAPMRTEDVPGSMEAVNALLAKRPEIKKWLIYSENDEGVMGAVRAMEQFGFPPENIIGIGIGGSTCLVEFRKEKLTGFFATILISPRRHGYETAELMYEWITQGKEPPKLTLTQGILVDRDSYEKVMKEQGLLD